MNPPCPYRLHHHDRLSWIIFSITAFLFLFLCLTGGLWGHVGEDSFNITFWPFNQGAAGLPGGQFIVLFWLTWMLSLLLLLLFPKNTPKNTAYFCILALSLFCRLALVPHEMSDDVNRYLWEGKLIREGVSPYLFAPGDPKLLPLAADDPFHRFINHPHLTAAYPPLVLLFFSWLGSIAYSPYVIKTILMLADLGTIALILRLLSNRQLDVRWVCLYAFNPVILYAFSGRSHFDVIQNCCLAAALLSYDKKSWGFMFLFAGLAVQTKYIAVAALPFLINRKNYPYIVVAVIAVVLPYLMFYKTGLTHFFTSIITFGETYAFNGSIHGLIRGVSGSMAIATGMCKILLAFALAGGYACFHPELNRRFRGNPVPGMFFSIGAIFLFMPTVHFWYLTWIIPFLALKPSRSWMVLCLTISLYFITIGIYHHTGVWQMPLWAQVLEWLPFYVLLGREIYLFFIRASVPVPHRPLASVSVVVPAKNEAGKIKSCIRAVQSDSAVGEVIVVDGGSADETVDIAKKAGATVLKNKRPPEHGGGRGGQIRSGIAAASNDVVAVVHADVLAASPVFTTILSSLNNDPALAGGAVGGVFSPPSCRLKLIEFLNDVRVFFSGISFGDQIQFFIRQQVHERDLFPDIPIMEDIELSIRLAKIGRTTYLFGGPLISSRRWEDAGFENAFLIIRLFTLYLWTRIFGIPDTVSMYNYYYGRNKDKAC